ncbi:MAG: NADH-dependent [FeFe] hydrogenase, group A6 [Polyangia bacterium]|jgi:NADH-quinone oxidoreductase subunit G/NADP-reducing hydrogenase subunit HndD|nr:NADH-dependent [FeFe] hydrogenase, group A6 [Polyangia bacterium]
MIQVEANGKTIEAQDGETLLTVLRRGGIKVPTLCHIPGLDPTGACRMCVVEVEGYGGLLPACSYPVSDGMKVQTHSSRVLEARRTVLELLLAGHPDDCLYCGRNGSCTLQSLASELGVRQRRFHGVKPRRELDISGPSIVRDPNKCILCGKCVRVCEEIQTVGAIDFLHRGAKAVVGTAFDRGLNVSSCVNCGQCILACPTGAIAERSHVDEVLRALADPSKHVVAQHAPAVSVTLAEEFGIKPGSDMDGQMVAALRRIGFDKVFDTSFSADLTIMEEGSELVHRVKTGGVLPMFTSCSPAWIKFVEQFYPDLLPHLSTCKSPQQMLGALVKTYYAEKSGIDPRQIVMVSIMPCTAKKFEATRPEMGRDNLQDVDFVLTTRELAKLLRMTGVDLGAIAPEAADTPFGERSSAGKLFGGTGGVMEAAVRTAYHILTGREMGELKIQALRGLKGDKRMSANLGGVTVNAAVVSGLGNARAILEEIRAGRSDLHFVEVMTCPGGCVAGGGQPYATDLEAAKARLGALYRIDRDDTLRQSHENRYVARLYEEYLGEPLGERSHHLLHTRYEKRDVVL